MPVLWIEKIFYIILFPLHLIIRYIICFKYHIKPNALNFFGCFLLILIFYIPLFYCIDWWEKKLSITLNIPEEFFGLANGILLSLHFMVHNYNHAVIEKN